MKRKSCTDFQVAHAATGAATADAAGEGRPSLPWLVVTPGPRYRFRSTITDVVTLAINADSADERRFRPRSMPSINYCRRLDVAVVNAGVPAGMLEITS